MDFTQLEDLFWQMTVKILGDDVKQENIRLTYAQEGQPNWKIDEDVIFIKLFEKDDAFSKQLDNEYKTERGTVIKRASRTRVWDVMFTAYGPRANTNINKIKDGVFLQEIKYLLSRNSVFLVPNFPQAKRVPEQFAGQWWNRWDVNLTFNELYKLPDEDVGHIDLVSITVPANR